MDNVDMELIAKRNEIFKIRGEVASRDYRALKAFKLGKPLEELYPGEKEWYIEAQARRQELDNELKAALSEDDYMEYMEIPNPKNMIPIDQIGFLNDDGSTSPLSSISPLLGQI